MSNVLEQIKTKLEEVNKLTEELTGDEIEYNTIDDIFDNLDTIENTMGDLYPEDEDEDYDE